MQLRAVRSRFYGDGGSLGLVNRDQHESPDAPAQLEKYETPLFQCSRKLGERLANHDSIGREVIGGSKLSETESTWMKVCGDSGRDKSTGRYISFFLRILEWAFETSLVLIGTRVPVFRLNNIC